MSSCTAVPSGRDSIRTRSRSCWFTLRHNVLGSKAAHRRCRPVPPSGPRMNVRPSADPVSGQPTGAYQRVLRLQLVERRCHFAGTSDHRRCTVSSGAHLDRDPPVIAPLPRSAVSTIATAWAVPLRLAHLHLCQVRYHRGWPKASELGCWLCGSHFNNPSARSCGH